jgi:hypothetical protein
MNNEVKLDVRIRPEIEETIQKISSNIEATTKLMKENNELLSEVLKRSFEVVETPLDSPQVVS